MGSGPPNWYHTRCIRYSSPADPAGPLASAANLREVCDPSLLQIQYQSPLSSCQHCHQMLPPIPARHIGMHLFDVADSAVVGEKGCQSSRSRIAVLSKIPAVVGTPVATGSCLEFSRSPSAKHELSAVLASSPISYKSNSSGRAGRS